MAKAESSLVVQRMPWHANFTELNHLGKALIIRPDVFSDVMTRVYTAYRYSDNPLTRILGGKSTERTRNNEWEWKLMGASSRPLVYRGSAAVAVQGTNFIEFNLPLDENFYLPGDMIHPGNPAYQCRIQYAPTHTGNAWIYRVVAQRKAGIPVKYLKNGVKWAKLFSKYEEGSEQSGSTQYALPMMLKNKLSRLRKQYMVTGDAANQVLSVGIPDATGKMANTWIRYAEDEFWRQWYREEERNYWYSRSSTKILGSTGRPTLDGAGLEEQLEESHREPYNVLTAKLIEEFISTIFYSRISPGGGRKLRAFTGEWGMVLFHRALAKEYTNSGWVVLDTNFVEKASSPYHSNALSYGYQFTKFKMPNGAELELTHNPLYDDREIHFEMDPVTGFPYESMKITFMDFAGEGMESNVKLVEKEDSYRLVYIPGLESPFSGGGQRAALASHGGDYYQMEVKKQCGAHITDISRMGQLYKRPAA